MIRLEIEKYCHDCPDFEVDVKEPECSVSVDKKRIIFGDTLIRCAHRDLCSRLCTHLLLRVPPIQRGE